MADSLKKYLSYDGLKHYNDSIINEIERNYLPLAGGALTGDLSLSNGTNQRKLIIRREANDVQYEFQRTINYKGEGVISAYKSGTEFNTIKLGENDTEFSKPISVNEGSQGSVAAQTRINIGAASQTDLNNAKSIANTALNEIENVLELNTVTSDIHRKDKEVCCQFVPNTDIHVVSHINSINNVGNENFLPPMNYNTTWNGITYTWNSDGSFSVVGTTEGNSSAYELANNGVPVIFGNGTYVLSIGDVLPEGVSISMDAYRDAGTWSDPSGVHSFKFSNGNEWIFTPSPDYEYIVTLNIDSWRTVDFSILPRLKSCQVNAIRSITLTVANDAETKQYSVDFNRYIYNGKYDWNSGKLIDLDTNTEYFFNAYEIKALDGLNYIKDDAGIIEVEGLSSDIRSEKMKKYNHISRMYLYGNTANMSKDNAVMLRFKYDGAYNYINDSLEAGLRENGRKREGWVKVKWQGSSSIAFPKKNYTFTFYWDENGNDKRGMLFKSNWGFQSKYNAKANFIDPTHCRNVVAAKLWGECVRSRNQRNQGSESYIYMNALPNAGAIDGYPMLVFVNDEYQGIYTMNIPKDEWMFGMKDGEGMNAVLCGENYSESAMFYGPFNPNSSDWSYEVEPDSNNKSKIEESFGKIYEVISMPENSASETDAKRSAIKERVDIYSVIDYDIFLGELGLSDNNGKNQLMVTYDGNKWIMSAYDLDTAFGNHWSGAKYLPSKREYDYGNGLTWAVKLLFPDEYAIRKKELKNGCLNKTNIMNTLLNFSVDIPQEAYRAEAELWPDMCGANANAMQQIVSFIEDIEDIKPSSDGKNLFTYTSDFGGSNGDPWYSLNEWQDNGETYMGLAVRQKSTDWGGLSQYVFLNADEEYTLSAWIKRNEGADILFYAEDTDRNGTRLTDVTGTDWRRISMTFRRYTSGISIPRFENSVAGKTMYICGLKLEKGNVATDWTHSPEDVLSKKTSLHISDDGNGNVEILIT